jgi:hypothetical protein
MKATMHNDLTNSHSIAIERCKIVAKKGKTAQKTKNGERYSLSVPNFGAY